VAQFEVLLAVKLVGNECAFENDISIYIGDYHYLFKQSSDENIKSDHQG